jgi:hypothetical protein
MIYVLHARKDQLASVFLSNIAEIIMCMSKKWIPLLPVRQYYDTDDRETEHGEFKDHALFLALRKLFARATNNTNADSWMAQTIDKAALGAVMSARKDVVTTFRETLRHALLRSLDDSFDLTKRRHVVAIHVRMGDVSHLLYDQTAFSAKSQKYIKVLDNLRSRDVEKTDIWGLKQPYDQGQQIYDWGQCAMSKNQIRSVIKDALKQFPGMHIEIITHKITDEMRELAALSPLVTIKADEPEMKSIYRLATAKHLFLANSYMGFLGGILSDKDFTTVFYPPNMMYAFFGLGSKYDQSNWLPMSTNQQKSAAPASSRQHTSSVSRTPNNERTVLRTSSRRMLSPTRAPLWMLSKTKLPNKNHQHTQVAHRHRGQSLPADPRYTAEPEVDSPYP